MTLPAPAVNPHLPPLLLSIVRTDRRTEGRTLDRLMAFTHTTQSIDVKTFFLFWSRFYVFNVFFNFQTCFYLKNVGKVQSSMQIKRLLCGNTCLPGQMDKLQALAGIRNLNGS